AGDADALRALLAEDAAAADARAENGDSPLLAALYHGRRDLAELVRGAGRTLDAHEAAALGDTERLRALLDADPGAVGRLTHDGWSMLHYAAFFGHVEAVRLLLARGADPNQLSTSAMRNTPLHAGLSGPLPAEGVRLLLEAGADVSVRQHGGYAPMHSAAARGSVQLMEMLRARGAETDPVADDGRRPVDFARERGHADAMAWLRAHGAAEPAAAGN
ncbi:MAG TPA: ankyrin repeat domain-containing protein, partial [Longimicrobium sp.]|nr:ankyrin repeat domain-containing protein [Longimicrobium sp.]